jgi:hypothetical protein
MRAAVIVVSDPWAEDLPRCRSLSGMTKSKHLRNVAVTATKKSQASIARA